MDCWNQIVFSYKAVVDHFTMVKLTAADFMVGNFKIFNSTASLHLHLAGHET